MRAGRDAGDAGEGAVARGERLHEAHGDKQKISKRSQRTQLKSEAIEMRKSGQKAAKRAEEHRARGTTGAAVQCRATCKPNKHNTRTQADKQPRRAIEGTMDASVQQRDPEHIDATAPAGTTSVMPAGVLPPTSEKSKDRTLRER